MQTVLTIGELAKAAEVGVETIRFYEREGLIAQPPRPRAGYRRYLPETVRRVRFIRRAKDLGFSLKEIGQLLALRVAPETTCAEVRALARSKISNIETRIGDLQRIQRVLERLARTCRGTGPTSECPILDLLDEDEEARRAQG